MLGGERASRHQVKTDSVQGNMCPFSQDGGKRSLPLGQTLWGQACVPCGVVHPPLDKSHGPGGPDQGTMVLWGTFGMSLSFPLRGQPLRCPGCWVHWECSDPLHVLPESQRSCSLLSPRGQQVDGEQ